MRKAFILMVVMALASCVDAQKTTIKGKISGMNEGTQIVISMAIGAQAMPLDTVVLNAKGEYNVRLEPEEPSLYIITALVGKNPALHAMVTPGDKLSISGQYIESYNFIQVTESKGSKDAELYHQFNNLLIQQNSEQRIEELLKNHTDCLMSAFLVTYFDRAFLAHASLYESIRDGLIEKYPNNGFVKTLDMKVKSALLPGSTAPEIEMRDPQGEIRRLSDLKGKVVMIDFWASWCNPCRRENPNVVKLYHKYHEKGFEIYSVSMDKSRDAWLAAIAADGLVWPNHVSDLKGWTSSGGATYGIASIPATVLIDKEGKIIARDLRGNDLANKLKEIFGE